MWAGLGAPRTAAARRWMVLMEVPSGVINFVSIFFLFFSSFLFSYSSLFFMGERFHAVKTFPWSSLSACLLVLEKRANRHRTSSLRYTEKRRVGEATKKEQEGRRIRGWGDHLTTTTFSLSDFIVLLYFNPREDYNSSRKREQGGFFSSFYCRVLVLFRVFFFHSPPGRSQALIVISFLFFLSLNIQTYLFETNACTSVSVCRDVLSFLFCWRWTLQRTGSERTYRTFIWLSL